MKKKIIFVITKSVWGGAQKCVYDLAANLPTDRFDLAVAAGGDGPLFEKLTGAGIRTISIPKLDRNIHIGKEIRSFAALLNLFQKEQPDIIHLNSSKVGGLGALAGRIASLRIRKHIAVIFTVHGWGFFEDRSFISRAAIFLTSWVSVLFQDKIILINSRDHTVAQKIIPKRKLALIPNGLAYRDYMSAQRARAFFAEKIGKQFSPDTLLIGTIAELTSNKGLEYLIDAAVMLRPHLIDRKFRIVVIGEGEERSHLERKIRDLRAQDIISLLGFVPDAAQYLRGMDIFVLPSRKEGLPYVVMEAMAAGVPVIASNTGGIPDLITNNETGILVPPKDAQALAQEIEHLAKNKENRIALSMRAASTVETKFSLHAMLEKTEEVYETAD
jgi:glycosyltransferase involved in cell wall biosynthesis